jgi:hypothetical protein
LGLILVEKGYTNETKNRESRIMPEEYKKWFEAVCMYIHTYIHTYIHMYISLSSPLGEYPTYGKTYSLDNKLRRH